MQIVFAFSIYYMKDNTLIVRECFAYFSALQTKTDTFAISVDPDEMAHYEPSHLDLHYLPFVFVI